MKSKKIQFEKLANVRDFGGLTTKSGKRFKPGKLIRSGSLSWASNNDLKQLEQILDLIIDFRTLKEVTEKPDPVLSGIENLHLPMMQDLTDGITREDEATGSVISRFAENSEAARVYMCNVYKNFITDNLPIKNYSKFINLLNNNREKAILWHCTAGKDRAGFGAVIIQEILGVDRDTIFEDYLYTNDCLKDEIKLITLNLMHKFKIDSSDLNKAILFQKSIEVLFGAREEYLSGLYDKIKEIYGDFNTYIHKGLNISDKTIENLEQLYLE